MRCPLFYACMIAIGLVSCNNKSEESLTTRIDLDQFPVSVELEGRSIQFDTINGLIGGISVTDSMYLFAAYHADHYLIVTDTAFNILGYTARKGTGPGEVTAMVWVSVKSDDNTPTVYDLATSRLYSIDKTDNYKLIPKADFTAHSPKFAIQMRSGDYVFVNGWIDYGLGKYVVAADTIAKWPLGYNFPNPDEPKQAITCMHGIDYSPKHGIIAETYHGLQVIIFYNEDGEVVKIISLGDGPTFDEIDFQTPYRLGWPVLTDNYIYIRYGDRNVDADGKVFVFDYDFNPVAELRIAVADEIAIDAVNRRLIGVNPKSDEENIMVYNLPDCIKEP